MSYEVILKFKPSVTFELVDAFFNKFPFVSVDLNPFFMHKKASVIGTRKQVQAVIEEAGNDIEGIQII